MSIGAMAGLTRQCSLPRLFVSFLLFSAVTGLSDFQRKLKGKESAHNDAFHASLLKQLADSRSNSTTSDKSLPASHLALDLEAPTSFATFATNATDSLQIYTSDSLPTNPAPPSPCATAMTATIPFNATITLMAYAVSVSSSFSI